MCMPEPEAGDSAAGNHGGIMVRGYIFTGNCDRERENRKKNSGEAG
jgi:hypothetical protein